MKKRNRRRAGILTLLFLFTAASRLSLAQSEPAPHAVSVIRMQADSPLLRVDAVLSRLPEHDLVLSFSSSDIYTQDSDHPGIARLSALESHTPGARILKIRPGVFQLDPQGMSTVNFSYTLDIRAGSRDNLFINRSATTIFIPGAAFFPHVTVKQPPESRGEYEHFLTFNLIHDYEVVFENLPKEWKILTPYPQPGYNRVLIAGNEAEQALINAGLYQTLSLRLKRSEVLLAFDKGFTFNINTTRDAAKKILQYYAEVFESFPRKKIVLLVRENPASAASGYHVDNSGSSIVFNMHGIDESGFSRYKKDFFHALASSTFQIWFPHGFNTMDDWSWFWQGLSQYLAGNTLVKLGLEEVETADRALAKSYFHYQNYRHKYTENLMDAALKPSFREQDSFVTAKGMLVAYLLDERLKKQGKDLPGLLKALYKEYGNKPVVLGNRELLRHIDDYLGNAAFSRDYILGTKEIRLKDLDIPPVFYYWWMLPEQLRLLPWYVYLSAGLLLSALPLSLVAARLKRRKKKKRHAPRSNRKKPTARAGGQKRKQGKRKSGTTRGRRSN